jgi:hypothetical protein
MQSIYASHVAGAPQDLADQVVGWHHLVEIKGIEQLTLPAFPPTHHAPLPADARLRTTESRFASRLNESFATESHR